MLVSKWAKKTTQCWLLELLKTWQVCPWSWSGASRVARFRVRISNRDTSVKMHGFHEWKYAVRSLKTTFNILHVWQKCYYKNVDPGVSRQRWPPAPGALVQSWAQGSVCLMLLCMFSACLNDFLQVPPTVQNTKCIGYTKLSLHVKRVCVHSALWWTGVLSRRYPMVLWGSVSIMTPVSIKQLLEMNNNGVW